MADTRDVVVIVGSLRKDSLNRKAANAIAAIAPASLRFEIVEIGQLPFYNQDLDEAPPAAWTAFRDRVRAADAVLFVTPEYNRSVPGVLKNAIDVGSRPYGKSVWSGKPAAIVTVSPGAIGGFGANHHLRQSLVYLDMPTTAAARGVHRQRRRALRRQRRHHQRRPAEAAREVRRGVCGVD